MKHKNNIIKLCLGIFLAFTMALPAIAQKTQTFKGVVRLIPIIAINEKTEYSNTITIHDRHVCFCLSKYDCRTLHG